MAIAIPVGLDLGASMYLTIAAVLSGGLMGDHVSPISDTTVLASVGADCNHLDHVTSQGAYAGITGLATIFAYWMAGLYQTPYVLIVAMVVLFIAMTLAMKIFGTEAIPQGNRDPRHITNDVVATTTSPIDRVPASRPADGRIS